MRGEQEDMAGKACPGGQEAIELPGLFEFVESAEGDEHALASFAVVACVLDDLEILPGPGLLDAEEHGGLPK